MVEHHLIDGKGVGMSRPNILFLLSDEHSHRWMGHVPEEKWGEPVETPTFDRLASHSTVFTDAYCQMPLCTPSRLCLLTGREARRAGAWSNTSVLRPELPTLPGTLRDSGYETCLVGKMHLGGTQQFVGFNHRPYGDLTGKAGHQSELYPEPNGHDPIQSRTKVVGETSIPESLLQDQIVSQETVSFIREHHAAQPDKPWFVCASFSRPHFPLTAPARFVDKYWPDGVTKPRVADTGDAYDHPMSVGMRKGFHVDEIDDDENMRARAAYFACVAYLDEVISDLFLRLEGSRLLDNTIIVYTSDHGEMAGEHGVWWKNGWYEGCTRVPLIISLPEHRQGGIHAYECNTPVGLIDLFPTLCSLADTPIPEGLDGIDLSDTIKTHAPLEDRPIYSDNLMPRWGQGTEFRSIRWKDYKYIRFRNAPPLFFNVKNDPGEQHNLIEMEKSEDDVEALSFLSKYADESIDFNDAEQDRLVRDGQLKDMYAHHAPESTGNLYSMPHTGKIINAEDTLYHPTVISEDGEDIFGPAKGDQNKHATK
jgi:choline-sulfatase